MPNERAITLRWAGEGLRFEGRGTSPESPAITIDGDAQAGPSPMLTLLLAAAGCSGADVVSILQKMRVTITDFTVDVHGTRREIEPKRYTAIAYRFRLESPDARQDQLDRAVALSLQKYCSVVHTLAPDVTVTCETVPRWSRIGRTATRSWRALGSVSAPVA